VSYRIRFTQLSLDETWCYNAEDFDRDIRFHSAYSEVEIQFSCISRF